MNQHKNEWLSIMYQSALIAGYGIYDENPDICEVELSSEIYNFLMQDPSYKKYQIAVDNRSKYAANDVLYAMRNTIKNGFFEDGK